MLKQLLRDSSNHRHLSQCFISMSTFQPLQIYSLVLEHNAALFSQTIPDCILRLFQKFKRKILVLRIPSDINSSIDFTKSIEHEWRYQDEYFLQISNLYELPLIYHQLDSANQIFEQESNQPYDQKTQKHYKIQIIQLQENMFDSLIEQMLFLNI
ncbi:hypothetical protein ABPG74_018925 [Tetrahymena malaccensis]